MLNILGDLAAEVSKPRNPCGPSLLEGDLRAAWEQVLPTSFSSLKVARWFADHGAPQISEQVIRKHRVGLCRACQTSSQT